MSSSFYWFLFKYWQDFFGHVMNNWETHTIGAIAVATISWTHWWEIPENITSAYGILIFFFSFIIGLRLWLSIWSLHK